MTLTTIPAELPESLLPAPGNEGGSHRVRTRPSHRSESHATRAFKVMLSGLVGSWMTAVIGLYLIWKGIVYFDKNIYSIQRILFFCAVPLMVCK